MQIIIAFQDAVPLLFSSIIGGIIAIIGDALLNWRKERLERNRLRRVLLAEIKPMEDVLTRVCDGEILMRTYNIEDGEVASETIMPSRFYFDPDAALSDSLYHQNMDVLRILTEKEIEIIIDLYMNISGVRGGLPDDTQTTMSPRTISLAKTCLSQHETILKMLRFKKSPLWKRIGRESPEVD